MGKISINTYKLFTVLLVFACIFFFFITNNSTASATELSQQEKEELHQQYIEILEEVKYTVTWGEGIEDIEVTPIDRFEEEDWVSLEEFKQRAIEETQVNAVAALANSIKPFSTTFASRKVDVRHFSTPIEVTVSANFSTQLNFSRQVFASYSNLRTTPSRGNFTRTGVDARIIDLGRTYKFNIGGKLDYLGLTTSQTLYTEFYCSPTGVVS